MRAWYLDEQTGLGALRLDDNAPLPEPASGEVRLRLRFAALNPADRYLAEKLYPAKPTFPHILGRDGIGVVDAIGAGVDPTAHPLGAQRLILRGDAGVNKPGTFAEAVCIPADLLAEPPASWTPEEATGAALVYLTAIQALQQWDDSEHTLGNGDTVLITGASGGVGSACCQLARALGCKVIAFSRSAEKSKTLSALGADLVLDPGDADLVKKVREFASKPGVRVAVDNIGGDLFPKLIATLGHRGAISCVGRLAGPVPEFNTATLFFRRNRIGGVSAGDYTSKSAHAAWQRIVALLGEIDARPLVDRVFALEDLRPAFDHLAKGPMGKVLLRTETGQ